MTSSSARALRALLALPVLLAAPDFVCADPPQPPPAQFVIRCQFTNLVMDVRGARATDGTPVQTYSPNNGQNQSWLLLPQNDGSYLIKSAMCEKFLDVVGDPELDHSRLVINSYTGRSSQRWFLKPVGKYYVISNATRERGGIGLVIDVPGKDDSGGTQLQVFQPNGGGNQLWILQRVK
jgi:hypothetical protein